MSETRELYLVAPLTGEILDPPTEELDLSVYGFDADPMGLHPAREINVGEWSACWDAVTGEYKRMERKATWIQFVLGDLLVLGEGKFGEQIWDYVDPKDYELATIRNFKSIAKNVPASRRNERLTFKHHSAVSGLSAHEQSEWLERAEREGISANALYEQVGAGRGIAPRSHEVTCPECGAQFTP